MRTPVAILIALFVTSLSAGCASVVRGLPADDVVAAPAAQVVFQVDNDGISVAGASDFRRPGLTVYGDGTTYRIVPQPRYDRPVVFEHGHVEPSELQRLARLAERSRLFDAKQPIMGRPGVTDMPTTSLSYRPGRGPARTVAAYALSFTEQDDDLGSGARANRAALRQLLDELDDAFVRPTGNPQWTPDRIDVSAIDRSSPAQASAVWPGPPLATVLHEAPIGRCGVLTGSDARRVYESALRNDNGEWLEGGSTVRLIVRPLLPGETGCRR